MSSRRSVLLATEGTYPFHKGGVSTWCDVLTWQLPEIDFRLLAVTMHPYLGASYALAPNVELLPVPLWGTEHPAEFDRTSTFADYLERRWRTTPSSISSAFAGPFERFLRLAVGHGIDLPFAGRDALADALVELHEFFLGHDIARAFFAAPTFELFERCIRELHAADSVGGGPAGPAAADAVEALRLLYRLLLVLAVRIPKVDVTHAAAAAFCGLPCVVARRRDNVPFLLTEHGIYVREQYLNLRRIIASPFVRWFMYRIVGAVTAVNYHAADLLTPVCAYNARWEQWARVPAGKIQVIYNGVDPTRFQPAPRPASHRPTIANIGLIFPLKNQLGLIDAAALVRRHVPDVRVVLHGSASDDEYYAQCVRRVAELGLERTVEFAGPTTEPWKAYQAADVVAMSSVSEGFPYAVIEAMLCGAAIVATDTGGVSEAIEGAGLIVPPRDTERMAEALSALLLNPKARAVLGAQARAKALASFTQEQFLAAYREAYDRLTGRRDRTRLAA